MKKAAVKKTVEQIKELPENSQIISILVIEIVLGIIALISALSIFLKLSGSILEKEVLPFDSSIIHFVYSFRSPEMTTAMQTLSFLGGQYFLGGAIILTIALLYWKHHRKDSVIFSFILFFGIGLNLLLKDFFHRPRPDFMPLVHETSYSFPSGHAMNSFVFYMTLSYFVFHLTRKKHLGILATITACILVFFIGVSRIYLGAHYPSDVVAGFSAGLLWFVIMLLFEKTLLFLRLFRRTS